MTFPAVDEAFAGWDLGLQFKIVTKTAVDGELVETPTETKWFRAVLEPVLLRELKIKPEGQRAWQWYHLYSTEVLDIDAIILDEKNKKYRVMSTEDWSLTSGYTKYELAQAPNL